MFKPLPHFILIGICAFLGGAMVQFSFLVMPSMADVQKPSNYQAVFDTLNKKGIETFVYMGQPMQKFYGENGKMRLQVGTYDRQGERGQPMITLSDAQEKIKFVMRLAGPNEAPVLLFKDKTGRDRMIIGLDPNGQDENPMMVVIDKDGKRRSVLAN